MESVTDNDLNVDDLENSKPVVSKREDTRQSLAYWLLWLFCGEVVVIAFAVIFHTIDMDYAKDLALITITPTTSILGIVVGFFFGEGNR